MTQTDVASTQRQAQDEDQDQRSRPPRPWAAILKWALLLVVVALAGLLIQRLLEQGLWLAVVGVAFVAMAIVVVYGVRRAVPLKYLMPGLLLLLALQVWPIVYTVATAFTNYGDGHRISKQESVDSIIANSVREVPGTKRYKLSVAVKEGTDIAAAPPVFLLTDASGATSVGDVNGLESLPADGVQKTPHGQGHRGARLHDPQRAGGQRPQGPRHVRRADTGRRRHQARRPERGVRGQADRLLRQGDRHPQGHRHRQDVRRQERPVGAPGR